MRSKAITIGLELRFHMRPAWEAKVKPEQGSPVAAIEIGAAGLYMDKVGSVMSSLFSPW